LGEREARFVIKQIFAGLKYIGLQRQKIIHYDLKPANILFHQGVWKICDFGLSKIMNEDAADISLTSQGAGTYWYLPPECLQRDGEHRISTAVDVWSCGVIFFELLYGKKPFGHGKVPSQILSENLMGQWDGATLEFPPDKGKLVGEKVTEECKDFIRKCLAHDPGKRPDIQEIENEPYLVPKKRATGKD
jgi:tousled-like kinase